MITYSEALEQIVAALKPAAPVTVGPGAALGAGLGKPVASRLNVPDFDNAAMDGIAVRAADVAQAAAGRPVTLRVIGVAPAGHRSEQNVDAGQAVEIMTGAPMPPGADTVIPVERVEWREADGGDKLALVEMATERGRNVRRAGEDFCAGDQLLAAGNVLSPEAVMNLAAGGVDEVVAVLPPAVAVITTGSELAASGAPTGTGKIRDSNGPYLAAGLAPMGGALVGMHSAADEPDALAAAMTAAAAGAQLVLTTGGVSAGKFDCVPAAVVAAGGEVLFHKVAIRPGKPMLFAALPDDRWLLGLPGNPVAVAVGLRFFVAPALRVLRGLAPEQALPARSSHAIRKRPDLRFFGKASATVSAAGQLEVALLPGQESFRVRPLLAANCWAIVAEDRDEVAPGELIEIAPLYPTSFLQTS
ncbi:MAG: molybdopterin molybdotransferase MoeA [Chromatiales bacterium]|nr:MAG: molybdopterin molybdotransferase MoeA [Chromatiales bacterium]